MQVTEEMLDKMAKLARLTIEPDRKQALIREMTDILGWVDKLNEIDTEGVPPLIHMSHEINKVRQDKVEGQLSQQQALRNAPDTDGEFFRVPKVIKPADE
jgi:aspartyl-tRNA(Asn)/glutamyl-tRNA(Gln) amidotransferase subunit C